MKISKEERASWTEGDPKSWAEETNKVAKKTAYSINSPAGCPTDPTPIALTSEYDAAAQKAASLQLRKAGVRLASVLNKTLE